LSKDPDAPLVFRISVFHDNDCPTLARHVNRRARRAGQRSARRTAREDTVA